ncbi:MAG TPA: type II toxin-antitoxin system RelE/ParE family toxin [Verrucomicrobiae bacterium]|nr:type II toxin-antitoxin system RelE/ParE family toxin [Verrucomicrobiae bacterium]
MKKLRPRFSGWLSTSPPNCKKLRGREGWRIRVGDFRVVYEINDERRVVTILHVGHRREIYR